MTAARCPACGDTRETSCGADDCPVPLVVSGELDGLGLPTKWRSGPPPVEIFGLEPYIQSTHAGAIVDSFHIGAIARRAVVAIAQVLPPMEFTVAEFEEALRKNDAARSANHDPGDEDRST